MCIVAIAWQLFDDVPLVLLSNRDEFFARPTTAAHQWPDLPIYAGRDEKSGGTWLGIHQQKKSNTGHKGSTSYNNIHSTEHSQNGRWAAVLNFRDAVPTDDKLRSRGALVTEFLTSHDSPMAFARNLALQEYAGFNLIVGDAYQAVLVNNRGYPPTALHSGLHIISNGPPDSDWFKSERLRQRVSQEVLPLIVQSLISTKRQVSNAQEPTCEQENKNDLSSCDTWQTSWRPAALDVLSDTRTAPIHKLPSTGVPHELEHALSSIYIANKAMPHYGTRTQSILTMTLLPGVMPVEMPANTKFKDNKPENNKSKDNKTENNKQAMSSDSMSINAMDSSFMSKDCIDNNYTNKHALDNRSISSHSIGNHYTNSSATNSSATDSSIPDSAPIVKLCLYSRDCSQRKSPNEKTVP